MLTVIKENGRSGSSKDSLQTQCVHGQQSEVTSTKSSCQAAVLSSDWTIPSQADTCSHTSINWQLIIMGNPNYRGLQCLLKLLIITANNYSMPDLPLEGGWNNYAPILSTTTPYSQSESQPGPLTVCQIQSRKCTSTRPIQTVDGTMCQLSRNRDSLQLTFQSPAVQLVGAWASDSGFQLRGEESDVVFSCRSSSTSRFDVCFLLTV